MKKTKILTAFTAIPTITCVSLSLMSCNPQRGKSWDFVQQGEYKTIYQPHDEADWTEETTKDEYYNKLENNIDLAMDDYLYHINNTIPEDLSYFKTYKYSVEISNFDRKKLTFDIWCEFNQEQVTSTEKVQTSFVGTNLTLDLLSKTAVAPYSWIFGYKAIQAQTYSQLTDFFEQYSGPWSIEYHRLVTGGSRPVPEITYTWSDAKIPTEKEFSAFKDIVTNAAEWESNYLQKIKPM